MKTHYCPTEKKLTKTKIKGMALCCAECGRQIRALDPTERTTIDLVYSLKNTR